MVKPTIKIDDAGFKAKLAKLKAASSNMQPVYKAVGSALVSRIQLGFKTSTDPWGKKWLPLKIRKGGQPLKDTGLLARSFTSKATTEYVEVGTNRDYAAVHQFGATIKPVKAKLLRFPIGQGAFAFAKEVKIPARPFMPIRPGGTTIVLPVGWSNKVVRAAEGAFKKAIK